MTLTGEQYVIEAGAHRAVVVEVGAGLRRYTVGGVDVTGSYGDDTLPPKCCGATLVPWPNRIRDGRYSFDGVDYQLALTEPAAGNAIHGLGRWARWAPTAHDASSVTLRLDVVPQTGYPFEVQVDVTYALHAEDGLTVTLCARNVGSKRAPFGAGSHPYLSTRGHRLDDVTVQLPAAEMLVVDDRQIPVGAEPADAELRRGLRLGDRRFDAGFTRLSAEGGRGVAELRTESGGAQLWFDDTFRYLQVFTLDALGVAIEPMTCAPNAFDSGAGLIVLDPSDEWRGSWGILPLP